MIDSPLVMHQLIQKVEDNYRKKQVVDVRSGDTVRVHQKITEGNKERVQVFEGFVIRTDRKKSLTSRITVRRIASGVGVEKSFMLHSPLVVKVEVTKRAKVRRKNLTYMRERSGKSARLLGVDFDKDAVNTLEEILDKEVGEVVETPKPVEEKKEVSEKTEAKEDVKEEKAVTKEEPAEKPEVKESKTEEPKEEKKEISKKEKAEAFRKAQEEKKK